MTLAIANHRRVDSRHPNSQRRCIDSCGDLTGSPARGVHIATKWIESCAMLMGLTSMHEVTRQSAGAIMHRAPRGRVRPGEFMAPVRRARATLLWIALIALRPKLILGSGLWAGVTIVLLVYVAALGLRFSINAKRSS